MADKVFHRKLLHEVPPWVTPGSPFFITICTEPRGKNQLANPDTASALFNTVEHYQQEGRWYCHICLLMPDHLHMVVSFPFSQSMKAVMATWKSYNARFHSILW